MWITLIIIAIGAAFYFRTSLLQLAGVQQDTNQANAQTQAEGTGPSTITIRPATDTNQVSAAGNIEISSPHTAVLQVDGIISKCWLRLVIRWQRVIY